ncbi:cupin domain-containing protein [Sulfitobacter sp. D35]|uniref:cupin domain-containing protein n=1 Tax=Sulfitobacter sp. D35 TaxID=3083252 RepID=UPI00296F3134|nr:cupin domain-containing protein [Sulfitobacter sp. D35]MDW4499274.1 cupin domain-containing protein [Sulfitobacter sp. D35]
MDIGNRLRAIRESRGLSQRELAARAGLTNGTISLIEQNKTSPSVASLKSLLDAIPISIAEFFATLEEDSAPRHFYRADEFTEIAPPEIAGAAAQLLSLRQLGDAQNHSLQLLHERYAPGADTGPEFLSHAAEEAGVVIRGQIEVTVDGQIRVLGPGDGYLFDSRLPHRFRNTSDEECEVISACTPPSF